MGTTESTVVEGNGRRWEGEVDDGQRSGETRPHGVRNDRVVGEAQERPWDIARQRGGNDGDAGDGREHADGKGGAASGGNTVGATVRSS